jgi:hypothetical protein
MSASSTCLPAPINAPSFALRQSVGKLGFANQSRNFCIHMDSMKFHIRMTIAEHAKDLIGKRLAYGS